jgi:DNA-binding transcriptional ArsR family regulator
VSSSSSIEQTGGQPLPAAGPGLGDPDIAVVGALLADPSRCRVLLALDDGRALPAGRLAMEAGVSPATVSSHLRKLLEAGLLTVEVYGRCRYYRLAGPDVGRLIEALQQLAPPRPVASLRADTRARALRFARTCYDHLAGRLGVQLTTALLEDGRLDGGDGTFDPATARHDSRTGYGRDVDYTLTDAGRSFLDEFGVILPVVRYCVDWSEQRHHLAGALGRGLRDRLIDLDWVRPSPHSRAVAVTETGRDGIVLRGSRARTPRPVTPRRRCFAIESRTTPGRRCSGPGSGTRVND